MSQKELKKRLELQAPPKPPSEIRNYQELHLFCAYWHPLCPFPEYKDTLELLCCEARQGGRWNDALPSGLAEMAFDWWLFFRKMMAVYKPDDVENPVAGHHYLFPHSANSRGAALMIAIEEEDADSVRLKGAAELKAEHKKIRAGGSKQPPMKSSLVDSDEDQKKAS